IKTGDELETLADQFNDMAGRLQDSYADLEQKVEQRTQELRESLEQQTAAADLLRVISRSSFDLNAVLDSLVESVALLCDAEMAAICRPVGPVYRQVASYGFAPGCNEIMARTDLAPGHASLAGRVLLERKVVCIADAAADPDYALAEMRKAAGFRTM